MVHSFDLRNDTLHDKTRPTDTNVQLRATFVNDKTNSHSSMCTHIEVHATIT